MQTPLPYPHPSQIRVEALQTINSQLHNPALNLPQEAGPLLQCLMHLPGTSDSILPVNTHLYGLTAAISQQAAVLTKRDAYAFVTGAYEKLADVKLKGNVNVTIMNLAEHVGPTFIAT